MGRLHSWAPGCRRAGPAVSSAASSRPRDMHNYALDQTLPCCYGTMVLIARAQGPARIKVAASAQRDAKTQSPRCPWREAVRAHYDGGDQGTRNNSHSDAFNQSCNGPINDGKGARERREGVSAGMASVGQANTRSNQSHSACGQVEQSAAWLQREQCSEECTRARWERADGWTWEIYRRLAHLRSRSGAVAVGEAR